MVGEGLAPPAFFILQIATFVESKIKIAKQMHKIRQIFKENLQKYLTTPAKYGTLLE